jgi:mono/diheme cytochrome c family protein
MPAQPSRNSEHADPHEQYNPVPRVVLGLVLALFAWAIAYILMSRPDGVAELGDRRVPATLAQNAAAGKGTVDGRQIFVANCQACHQAAGQGLPGVFPPLAGASWVKGDPAILTQIVLHGLTGPIEVAGNTYNGAMPAFGAQLGDAELAAVLSFIRHEWGNGGAPVEAAMVAAARKASVQQSEPWTGIGQIERALAATAMAGKP